MVHEEPARFASRLRRGGQAGVDVHERLRVGCVIALTGRHFRLLSTK